MLAERLPRVVMPLVLRQIRLQSAGMIIVGDDSALGGALSDLRHGGRTVNINRLGEAVLGEDEARRRIDELLATIGRPDVSHVSLKVSAIASQLRPIAFASDLERVTERLRTVALAAATTTPPTAVTLDMETYDDLALTIASFKAAFGDADLLAAPAGLALQAYLPDSAAALDEIADFALRRRDRGGVPMKVRLVKGANLAMERVTAELAGWPQAPLITKAQVDANFKRLLERALAPELDGALRVGLASHNLFDIAWAMDEVERRGAQSRVDFEMLAGMAPAEADVVCERMGGLLLYTPVVGAVDFPAAVAYLVRRLDENTAEENFLRHAFDLSVGSPAWMDQRHRFEQAVAACREPLAAATRRTQDRRTEHRAFHPDDPFDNEPDTDWSRACNREWIRTAIDGGPTSSEAIRPPDEATVDAHIRAAVDAAPDWANRSTADRRAVLTRVAEVMADQRGAAIAVMVSDAAKVVTEADAEVSEAIDFARWYADQLGEIARLVSSGLRFDAPTVTVVASPWNFPYAIAAGGLLASLAIGSTVVLKPASETRRVAQLLAQQCWAAGVPRGVLRFCPTDDDSAGRRLITHPGVESVLLTGSYETAQLFLGWRPDLELQAETSGKNAMIISEAADIDDAIADLVDSAFGHGGQKCSAASLAIVEAAVYDGATFRRRLGDAVRSLAVGPAEDLASRVGPLIAPPSGKLAGALGALEPGESWLVAPFQLGADLWHPAVKLGVAPGSPFHRTECFGPVLGIMRARDLDHAIELQNATDYGLTGGLQSLDPDEIKRWLDRVEVGNAYVNRSTTGAIVRRQPFGGWKRSSIGSMAKAGGPNTLISLGRWHCDDLDLERARTSFRNAWDNDFGHSRDPTGLGAEANVLRYRALPAPVVVRTSSDTTPLEIEIARLAAQVTGTAIEVSSSERRGDVTGPVMIESDGALARRLSHDRPARLRLASTEAPDALLRAAHEAGVTVDRQAILDCGRIELVHWLREQSVSITRHRHGNITEASRRRAELAGASDRSGR